jgi:hypothetical protein
MRTLALVLLTLAVFLSCPISSAVAADGDSVETWRTLDDGTTVSLLATSTTLANGKLGAVVKVQPLDAKLANKGAAIKVYEGAYVISTLAVRPGSAAVLMYRGGATAFVKVGLVELGTGKSTVVDLPRTAGAGSMPTGAVACADADGFTFLWQEQGTGGGAAQGTIARVKADGTIVKKPTSVGMIWSLGAIVDDGRGYTLAVRYDGQAPDQTRIAFVTLTYDGTPEQHPWWGARPAMVGEIQMVMVKGVATAVYRAGDATQSILAAPADKVKGQWGKEADPSKILVTKGAANPFGARVKNGAIEVVQR